MDIRTYRELLKKPFTAVCNDLNSYSTTTPLEKHDILNGYLCAHVGREGAEVPAMILPFLTTVLSQPEIKWEQIAMPLFYTRTSFKRTSNTILRDFMLSTSVNNERLSKIITPKGEVYYGGQGIILDKDMEPYLLYTATVSGFEIMPSFFSSPTMVAKVTALNVRVSPKVFASTNIICKNIITKMIPALVYEEIQLSQLRGMDTDKPLTPKVIVEDLSSWIKRPKRAGRPEIFNEDMKDFLSREDIIQDIVGCL